MEREPPLGLGVELPVDALRGVVCPRASTTHTPEGRREAGTVELAVLLLCPDVGLDELPGEAVEGILETVWNSLPPSSRRG